MAGTCGFFLLRSRFLFSHTLKSVQKGRLEKSATEFFVIAQRFSFRELGDCTYFVVTQMESSSQETD